MNRAKRKEKAKVVQLESLSLTLPLVSDGTTHV